MSFLRAVVLLTLLFGATVALAWFGAGAVDDVQSGVPRITAGHAALQYTLSALAAATVGALAVRRGWLPASTAGLAIVVTASWLGEGLVFTMVGPVLADEIHITNAWWFWLVATGFGLQPLAGLVGGIVARSRAGAGVAA